MKRKAPIQRLLERPRIKQEGEKEVPPDDDDLFGELHAAAAAGAPLPETRSPEATGRGEEAEDGAYY